MHAVQLYIEIELVSKPEFLRELVQVAAVSDLTHLQMFTLDLKSMIRSLIRMS